MIDSFISLSFIFLVDFVVLYILLHHFKDFDPFFISSLFFLFLFFAINFHFLLDFTPFYLNDGFLIIFLDVRFFHLIFDLILKPLDHCRLLMFKL